MVCTFVLAITNYTMFDYEKKHHAPMSEFHRYVFIALLSGFCVTESMVAFCDIGPWASKTYILYVLLNLYGIKCLWRPNAIHQT